MEPFRSLRVCVSPQPVDDKKNSSADARHHDTASRPKLSWIDADRSDPILVKKALAEIYMFPDLIVT